MSNYITTIVFVLYAILLVGSIVLFYAMNAGVFNDDGSAGPNVGSLYHVYQTDKT